jgi:hypothetical protein
MAGTFSGGISTPRFSARHRDPIRSFENAFQVLNGLRLFQLGDASCAATARLSAALRGSHVVMTPKISPFASEAGI